MIILNNSNEFIGTNRSKLRFQTANHWRFGCRQNNHYLKIYWLKNPNSLLSHFGSKPTHNFSFYQQWKNLTKYLGFRRWKMGLNTWKLLLWSWWSDYGLWHYRLSKFCEFVIQIYRLLQTRIKRYISISWQ